MNIAWRLAKNVVRKQASWRPVLLLRATLLVKRAFNQYIEGLPIGRVVRPSKPWLLSRPESVSQGMGTEAGLYSGGELALTLSVLRVIPARQVGLWRLDSKLHAARGAELVNVWAALVRDPETAVLGEGQTLSASVSFRWHGWEPGI